MVVALLACAGVAAIAEPADRSGDGRWRVEGQGTAVVVSEHGRVARTIAATRLGGGEASAVSDVRWLPQRRSFAIAFATLPELWELSVDPQAPPLYEGLVHDHRLGEGLAAPGFLGVRRSPLDAPLQVLAVDAGNNAYLLARSAAAWWLINLDVRRPITRFELDANPVLGAPARR